MCSVWQGASASGWTPKLSRKAPSKKKASDENAAKTVPKSRQRTEVVDESCVGVCVCCVYVHV